MHISINKRWHVDKGMCGVNYCPMLELKYVVTNFKIHCISYWLMKQNTKNIFVPLDGTQSELQNTFTESIYHFLL